ETSKYPQTASSRVAPQRPLPSVAMSYACPRPPVALVGGCLPPPSAFDHVLRHHLPKKAETAPSRVVLRSWETCPVLWVSPRRSRRLMLAVSRAQEPQRRRS